jgi:quercetin dioxygenase-like cupin family protein
VTYLHIHEGNQGILVRHICAQSFDDMNSASEVREVRVASNTQHARLVTDADFTLGIFTIPAGRSIPLHDHPGMTVISRLLFGTLRVQVGRCTD